MRIVLAIVLLGLLHAAAGSRADAINPFGDASGLIALSVTGNADAAGFVCAGVLVGVCFNGIAISGTGAASGGSLSVSGTGPSQGAFTGVGVFLVGLYPEGVAVSGAGPSSGGVAASVLGPSAGWVAVSGTGDATGDFAAVSASGDVHDCDSGIALPWPCATLTGDTHCERPQQCLSVSVTGHGSISACDRLSALGITLACLDPL